MEQSSKKVGLERKRFMLFCIAMIMLIVGYHFMFVYTMFDVYMLVVGIVVMMFCTLFFGMVSIK